MSVEPRLTFSLIESNRRTSKDRSQPRQVGKTTKKNARQGNYSKKLA